MAVNRAQNGVLTQRQVSSHAQKFYTGSLTVRGSIFGKLLLTSVLLIGVTLASADFLLTRYTAERERTLVQQHMAQSLHFIAPALVSNPPKSLQKWAEDTDAALDSRVTVIDSGGVVLADSRHDPETMENHRARPEVQAALEGRPGSAVRRSATLDVEFYYYAEPVEVAGASASTSPAPGDSAGDRVGALDFRPVRMLVLRASAVPQFLWIALLLADIIAGAFTSKPYSPHRELRYGTA